MVYSFIMLKKGTLPILLICLFAFFVSFVFRGQKIVLGASIGIGVFLLFLYFVSTWDNS